MEVWVLGVKVVKKYQVLCIMCQVYINSDHFTHKKTTLVSTRVVTKTLFMKKLFNYWQQNYNKVFNLTKLFYKYFF